MNVFACCNQSVSFATQHVPIAAPEVLHKPWVWVRFGVTKYAASRREPGSWYNSDQTSRLPVRRIRPSSLNLSIPKQEATQTSGLSGHDCFSSWSWHRILGHSSFLLLAETNRIRQRNHTHTHTQMQHRVDTFSAGVFSVLESCGHVRQYPGCCAYCPPSQLCFAFQVHRFRSLI